MALLAFEDLSIDYGGSPAVEAVTFAVCPGEAWALLGPSGSGKSTLGLAAIGLLPATATVRGQVRVDGLDLAALPVAGRAAVRGWRVAYLFQSPRASFNPALRIGTQVVEAVAVRRRLGRRARRALAEARLAEVGLDPDCARAWPHQLSGGQIQRAALAMALATDPALLIADEPTASLDTIRQAEIVALLAHLRETRGLALLVITHDVGLSVSLCSQAIMLHEGRVVEKGPLNGLLRSPQHPYTVRWVEAASPRADQGNGHRKPTVAPPRTKDTAGPGPSSNA